MNRPPKKHKKKKDDILNDPRFDRKDLEEADRRLHKDASKGDDRNLVHIDDAFKEADIEDQVWLFWNKYKNSIYALVVIVLLGVIGVQGYHMYQRSAVRTMQEAYIQADTPEALNEFGQKYVGKPLAGFALLQSADKQYQDGNYSTAADLYKDAAASLTDTYVQGRARLGEAMAVIQDGQTEAGKALLTSLSSDTKALSAIRAEATFDLGVLALSAKDYDAAGSYLQQASTLDPQGPWGSQADRLIGKTPELAATVAPEAATAPAAAETTAPVSAGPANVETPDNTPVADDSAESMTEAEAGDGE
ncbi:tetratricopeptide repeat protein [Ruficoccus sp. ZRK36]|uniref:tetratricopeptide repeat protein n=1 Tax=Ruficoccus sp. ZRK36 TaxID=2866311 RepID=UPI001C73D489|nr:tetratricopeptide repeat protein [Ruficoccus sp. ZRK36]QYY36481.1 tetratricopeptide repeat protein [Ruficoccus sp. ZRK36]